MTDNLHSLLNKITRIETLFNDKNLRERILLALSCFAAIYMVWTLFFYQGLESAKTNLDNRLMAAEKNMTTILAQENVFARALSNDPNATIKYEILQLKERLETLDKDLQGLSVGLMPASNFASAVEDVLSKNDTLTLIGMTTLKPEKLNFSEVYNNGVVSDQENNGQTEEQKQQAIIDELSGSRLNGSTELKEPSVEREIGVFKHAVRVSISGRYFEVINYLRELESLSWTFYWSRIDYQVNETKSSTSDANVTFEIYTLSTDSGVFDV